MTQHRFINAAVAEKLSAFRTERYFRERAARAKAADFLAILERAGSDVVVARDELPTAEQAGGQASG